MKIAAKIRLSFLAVSIVIAAIAGSILYFNVKNSLERSITTHLETTSESRKEHIETYLKMLDISVLQLSRSIVLENFLKIAKDDPKEQDAFNIAETRLKRTKGVNPAIYEFLVLDTSGKVVASSNEASIGLDKSTDAFFLGGQKGTYIKDAYYSETVKEPLIAVSTPIYNSATGGLIGVLAARVRLDELYRILTNRTGLGKTGEIYIVNKYGYMITPSRFLKDTFLKQKVDTENFRMCAPYADEKSGPEPVITCIDYDGNMVLGTRACISRLQWRLLTEVDLAEAFAPLKKMRHLFIFILLLMPIIAWFFGSLIAAGITKSLDQLMEGAKAIGTGNLDYRVGAKGKDELGAFAKAFNLMSEDLKKKITAISDLSKEVAERKKAEEETEAEKTILNYIVNTIPNQIFWKDRSSVYLGCNDSFAKVVGLASPEEIVGKSDYELIWSREEAEAFRRDDERVMSSGKPMTNIEESHIRADGKEEIILTSKVPLLDASGQSMGIVGVYADITELRLTEKKLKDTKEELQHSEKLAALGRFATGIAHEVKNPLGIIMGGAEFLEKKLASADGDTKIVVTKILEAVVRANNILQSLLQYARPAEVKLEYVDPQELVKGALVLAEDEGLSTGFNISTEFAKDKISVQVNADQIIQVILNVLKNACEASLQGGQIDVKTHKVTDSELYQTGHACIIEVIDKGAGMSKDVLAKATEPFFTTKERKVGTGLSLFIAKTVLDNHRGKLVIESDEGKGADVKIILPCCEENKDQTKKA